MVWNLAIPANTFTDPDGDTLTLSAKMKNGSALPSWLTFDPAYKVNGAQGRFTGMPENAGVFNGLFEIAVTASDGVGQVTSNFTLFIGDGTGQFLFVPAYDSTNMPKVTVYDCIAPPAAGVARVIIGLDKPARETRTWRVGTANGANNGNSGTTYDAKQEFVIFQPGEQYKYFDVNIKIAMPTNRRVNVYMVSVGSNQANTILRSTGYIMTQAEVDALVAAGTPPMLPPGPASTPTPLPAVPTSRAGWTKFWDPDLVNAFEATTTGYSASDGVTPCWFNRPASNPNPMLGREQTGNSEDGIYAGNDVAQFAGCTPFPLVDIGGGVMKRGLRAEYLDGTNGKPGPIPSPQIAKTYSYTASMITSRRFAPLQVGDYVEVRAKMNPILHTWPAIWLLPSNFTWPPEIDLLEGFFSTISGDRMSSTVHWGSSNKAYGSFFGWSQLVEGAFDIAGWHTWGCELGPKWIVFYIDNKPYMMFPNMPLDTHGPQSWYLLLNIAIGGVGGGTPNNPQDFPADFLIDWVRFWRKTS